MIKDFTAEEFLAHLRRYEHIRVWGSRDRNSVMFIFMNISDLEFRAQKHQSLISGNVWQNGFLTATFSIAGNIFHCIIDNSEGWKECLLITTDRTEDPIRVELSNLIG